nr:PDZ domain-containing protein [bacterium]
GLMPGALIVRIGNRDVENTSDYRAILRDYTPGDRIDMIVIREGKETQRRMEARALPVDRVEELTWDLMGLQIRTVTRQDMRDHRLVVSEGALVTGVRPGSPAEDVGIKVGDVIARINRINVTEARILFEQMPYVVQQDAVILVVVRGSNAYRVTLTIQ